MSERLNKTHEVIFNAFNELLKKKCYHQIKVQEIIEAAEVSRTTFYQHFQWKDDLLKEFAMNLFDHVFDGVSSKMIKCDHKFPAEKNSATIITHLLYHLRDNHKKILELLTCDKCKIFLQFFKQYLNDLLPKYMTIKPQKNIPEDFIINHISGSFINMVQWWLKNDLKQSPEELTNYFEVVINPILSQK